MHTSPISSSLALQRSAVHLARAAAAFAATLACTAPAFAQAAAGEGQASSSWSVGVGVVSMQKPYTGIDRENRVLPVLGFENKHVRLFGSQVALKLPGLHIGNAHRLDFSLVGRYDGSGYEAGDAPILSAMDKRKSGFWVGAEVEWKNDLANLKAGWLADASGRSKGQRVGLGLERTWRVGERVMLTPRVEATWNDKKYVDYYFGVRDNEARPGRPAYVGQAGTGAGVGARGIYLFDRQHSVLLDVAVSSLAKEIKDSPLVSRSTENRVLLAYTYRFR